jgi:hypothetical protein
MMYHFKGPHIGVDVDGILPRGHVDVGVDRTMYTEDGSQTSQQNVPQSVAALMSKSPKLMSRESNRRRTQHCAAARRFQQEQGTRVCTWTAAHGVVGLHMDCHPWCRWVAHIAGQGRLQ